jgi:NADP-dependent 3-hydroxy acid dehydrogenase YdfG
MNSSSEPPTTEEATPIEGLRVLISGGTTGIGRACVLALARRGAHVFTFGRHEPELREVLKEAGGRVAGVTADAAKVADIERVFEEADKALGGLDVYVSNAALSAEGLSDMKTEDWRYVLETNLSGYLCSTKAAIEIMKKQKQGKIILIGSMSASVREGGSSVYVATKSAIQGLAEALRKEVNEDGIHVCLIEPGAVNTDMQPDPEAEKEKQVREHKMLKPEDIANSVLHLLTQPDRCSIVRMEIRPRRQLI